KPSVWPKKPAPWAELGLPANLLEPLSFWGARARPPVLVEVQVDRSLVGIAKDRQVQAAPEADRFLETPAICRDGLTGIGPAHFVEVHECLASAAVGAVERPKRALESHQLVAGRDGYGVARLVLVRARQVWPACGSDDLVHHALHGRV